MSAKMSSASTILSELPDLKCCLCDKALSIPPILHNGHGNVCGRCAFVNPAKAEKQNEWPRQHTYEQLAKHLTFPCCNSSSGCTSQLKWGEVEEHENGCVFRKLSCPLNNSLLQGACMPCLWIGSSPMLNEHLENSHTCSMKTLPEIDMMSFKQDAVYITKISKQLMVIVVKFKDIDAGKYQCLIMANSLNTDCDRYRFQIDLFDESRKNSVILRRYRIEDLICIESNLSNPNNSISIDLSAIGDILKNPDKIIARFGIYKKTRKELTYTSCHFIQNDNPSIDETLLRELECPVCKSYLCAPIHICLHGHSICGICRSKVNDCPSCRTQFSDGRNYALEQISALVKYPCINRELGCNEMLSLHALKIHEKDCAFITYPCFLGCAQALNSNVMLRHFSTQHPDSMISVEDLQVIDCSIWNQKRFNYVICYGNDVFYLTIDYNFSRNDESDSSEDYLEDLAHLVFRMEQFGVDDCNYNIQIEFVAPDNTGFTRKNSHRLNQKEGTVIYYSTVSSLIRFESLLFYKIHLKLNKDS